MINKEECYEALITVRTIMYEYFWLAKQDIFDFQKNMKSLTVLESLFYEHFKDQNEEVLKDE